MNYRELKSIFQELKRTSPKEDLTAHIVFTEDSFASRYPLLSRTYCVSSDNKAFRPNRLGYSIFARCLDPASDQCIRLDQHMAEEGIPGGWQVQNCYILEHMRDVAAIPKAERVDQGDGTVCWFFGDTEIRVREVAEDGRVRLEPISGDQAAYGAWEDLSIDEVCGYCTLLERHVNGRAKT